MLQKNNEIRFALVRYGLVLGFMTALGLVGACASDQKQLDEEVNASAANQEGNGNQADNQSNSSKTATQGAGNKASSNGQGALVNNAPADNFEGENPALSGSQSSPPADDSSQSQKGADVNSATANAGGDQGGLYDNNLGTAQGQNLLNNVPANQTTQTASANGGEANTAQYTGAGGVSQQTDDAASQVEGASAVQVPAAQQGAQKEQLATSPADGGQLPPAGWVKTSEGLYIQASSLSAKPVGRNKKIKSWR